MSEILTEVETKMKAKLVAALVVNELIQSFKIRPLTPVEFWKLQYEKYRAGKSLT